MIPRLRNYLSARGRRHHPEEASKGITAPSTPMRGAMVEVKLDTEDPLYDHLLHASGVVEIERLNLDSPALRQLKAAGISVSVPLISQGELIGVLNLGKRLSEQEYSADDRRLLNTLATQAAPALRVAQLARQQQAEARERERLEQELRVARIIQQTLLPKELPHLEGWQVAAHWQPARAVSGDFYDFTSFPDGKLGIAAGDVTDKGVPAALVMATTRSILRAAAERYYSPGNILAQANDLICPDIPANMFVTCLYILLDPHTGRLTLANAGHNLPLLRHDDGATELLARGMPLGLFPGAVYEEIEAVISPGDCLLIYSDGLVEAHNPEREMFGFPRLRSLFSSFERREEAECQTIIANLMEELANFTGPDWEQEDDVTLVVLDCARLSLRDESLQNGADNLALEEGIQEGQKDDPEGAWRVLAEYALPSEAGNEVQAMEMVASAVQTLELTSINLERLKTAVAEATMNAIEHGNKFQADVPVKIKVLASSNALAVQITDFGGGQAIPEPEMPDILAKLDGQQSPRGWGLFLIKNMVDEMRVSTDDVHHTVELIIHLSGDHA